MHIRRCRPTRKVMRYLVMGRTSTPPEVWRTMHISLGSWALRGYGIWACEKIDGGTFIGSVGIFEPLDWPEPEIACSLDQPFWHQGFATEGAGAARHWLFEHFPLRRAASLSRPRGIRLEVNVVPGAGLLSGGAQPGNGRQVSAPGI
jgi:RimJ/RimL family protein N-acetyltransferase